jgi:hypothetical protein
MSEAKSTSYEGLLSELEHQRDALDVTIRVIRQYLCVEDREVTPGMFADMTVGNAAEAYLKMQRKPKSTKDIANALLEGGIRTEAKNFGHNVHATLKRVEQIHKVGRALWAYRP